MNRNERRAAAAQSRKSDQATRTAQDVAAIYNAVVADLQAKKYLDAQMRCQRGIELHAEHPELLHLMALVCFNAGQMDHAAEWARRAAEKQPRPDFLTTLGTVLLNLARHDEALKAFTRAAELKPDDAGLWNKLGNAQIQAGRHASALDSFARALAINSRDLDANFKTGVLLHQQQRLQEALVYLDRCEALLPGQAAILIIRALVLQGLHRLDEALADNRRAHAVDPQNAYIRKNLGHSLMRLGRFEEALPWLDSALAIQPDFIEALNNKADALAELHRFEDAAAIYRHAKALDASHVETTWNFSLLQLLLGDFENGWAGREARFLLPTSPIARLDLPQASWLGEESVDGKTVLIYADEGLGDAIQFARYVPLLAARGARTILVVDPPLQTLMADVAGVTACLAKPIQSWRSLPAFDLHCPFGSLPLAFKTRLDTIPAADSWLPPPATDRIRTWEKRLGVRNRLRVGLVWSGNPKHPNDHNRSLPLAALSPLLGVDATFVSLQKNPRPADQKLLAGREHIVDLTAQLTDLADTAALIACLDLVITVDTSVAHLAATLGRPTWLLLPYTPDWRWLLDRDDTPWYPSMRLFRQNAAGDTTDVIDRVRAELSRRAAAHGSVAG